MDTDNLTDLEVFACTLIGEFENMGEQGMTEGACVVLNRQKANKSWMGGNNVRTVCLQPEQFSCWNEGANNSDRQRILSVANANSLYGPYVMALRIAGDAMAGRISDTVNGAVSYINHVEVMPSWAKGKTPVFIDEPIWFYSLEQVL